jgi:hypothetical protein
MNAPLRRRAGLSAVMSERPGPGRDLQGSTKSAAGADHTPDQIERPRYSAGKLKDRAGSSLENSEPGPCDATGVRSAAAKFERSRLRPVATGAARARIEATIDMLLGLVDELLQDLDRLDALTEDLEPEPDLEADADEEPRLGSLERIDQRAWSFGAGGQS